MAGNTNNVPQFSLEEVECIISTEDEQFLEAAVHHIDFLKEIDEIIALRYPKVINNALYRYEKLWLPLAASHQNDYEKYAPPIDVHWAWHSHLLAPVMYKKDCLKIVDCEINHRLLSPSDRLTARNNTRDIWEDKYPDEPFIIDIEDVENIPAREDYTSDIEYDVPLATTRQKTFYYNVALPHHRNPKFLREGLLRYKKFLFLRKIKHGIFIVPYYDQDLMWHTHQLFPQQYASDTTKYLGKVFNHDDTDGGNRGPNDKLTLANKETKVIWREVFGEAQDIPGSCYRGGIRHHDLRKTVIPGVKGDVCFNLETFDLKKFKKCLDGAMTKAQDISYKLSSGTINVEIKVQFHMRRNVFISVLYEGSTVVIGRNISNYEVPQQRQLSDGEGSWMHMLSPRGDIAMVIVDYLGDWVIKKTNKRPSQNMGEIFCWQRGNKGWLKTPSDQIPSGYSLDSGNGTLTVTCDDYIFNNLCSAFADVTLRLWPEAKRNDNGSQSEVNQGTYSCSIV